MARVLVIERDPGVAELIARRLRTYGHIVFTAPNSMLAKHQVGLDRPIDVAVIALDCQNGNGFLILDELRRHPELNNPQLPAILLANSPAPEFAERAKAVNALFLLKPVISGELQGAVLKATGSVYEDD